MSHVREWLNERGIHVHVCTALVDTQIKKMSTYISKVDTQKKRCLHNFSKVDTQKKSVYIIFKSRHTEVNKLST